jgi:hypothetical protein
VKKQTIRTNSMNKQLLLSILAASSFLGASAQIDPTAAKAALEEAAPADTAGKIWTTGGVVQVNLNQVSLTNWAAGGFSSVSGVAMFNGYANRRKGRHSWDNNLALAYGIIDQEGSDVIKTDDRIELNSRYGYDLRDSSAWAVSGLLQFRTQFAEGFDTENPDLVISDLMAPAYLLIGVGATYKPNDDFSVFISPAMSKITFVLDQDLADFGAFGVDAAEFNDLGEKIADGANSRFELGGFVALQYKKELMENITFITRADFFSNYLDNPQNIDVSWETMTNFKINDWFAATLSTLLLYDDDVDLIRDLKDDADTPQGVFIGPGTQFKQTLGLGLTFKL